MSICEFIDNNKIRGAIFDMDGTLTDSMKRWSEIYSILARLLKIELPQEFLMKYNHYSMKNCAELLIKDFCLNVDARKVYEEWLNLTVKYYENIFTVKPFMLETLKTLNALGIKMCVATASDRECAKAFVKSNALGGYLRAVIALDDVSRPKSFPDIYLKAAETLDCKPAECLVFEDALTAIKGAKSGGFKVCGVYDGCSVTDAEEIQNISDIVLGF